MAIPCLPPGCVGLMPCCVRQLDVHCRAVDAKTERWTLRVTPAQDTIVRRVLQATGMSLNEYVVGCAVASAANDLADRQVFVLTPEAWDELQDILDRPKTPKPEIAALLSEPSILDSE